MLTAGVRIVRGPDWTWGNQDGGEGFVGTVCEIGKTGSVGSPDKTVVVQWDNGTRTNYRVGYLGKYDLRVIDNAQIGVKHPNIVCDGCKSKGIAGIRYKCVVCYDFDLCYQCYHNDAHNLEHVFRRFDYATSSGVDLPPRQNVEKSELRGIFVGAKVTRGYNWEWGNQDGGEGKTGRVLDIRGWDKESSRSVANVAWSAGSTNVYRLGHKGDCDIKCVEAASGGPYYAAHLPVLGQQAAEPTAARRAGPLPFTVGDRVKVQVGEEGRLRGMQQGHGGWNAKMAEYVGRVGKVHRVTDKGDIRVQYEGCHNRWTFNPAALTKVNTVAVGDVVCLRSDMEKVKELQKGHGEWIEIMKNSLGKLGKILKIYSDGDLRVQLDGHAWTLNPQCVRLVPGSAAELANTMQASQNQRQEPCMEWQPTAPDTTTTATTSHADHLVRAAAQGHLDAVQRHLDAHRPAVDARSGGKTALQVAAHQGHAAIAHLLLTAGASVNAADNDGDACLHYAAFGNQPAILATLIRTGANLNAANRSGCTALHIAAHKQPAECVRILVEAGADANCTDLYGDTALHDAIGKDSFQVIELLCSVGNVDFTLRNKRGFNPLHHAALKGKNFATRKLLNQARQLVDVKKDDGFAALHLAALNGHRDVVETLVQVGQADINLRNNRNQTALLLAVSQGHCSVIELLIQLKANINAKDEDEDTALHLVLIKKAHLNAEITEETSPEIYAIYERLSHVSDFRLAISIACYLIEKGVDLDVLNSKSQSALSLVQDGEIIDILKACKPSVGELEVGVEAVTLEARATEGLNVTQTREGRRGRPGGGGGEGGTMGDGGKPVECEVCSELSEENVKLEPCGHKPACEECSSRMRKCLQCGGVVQRRVTKDGRTIPGKSRQPSAERMRYLECKIAEIEESHACSICMERKRNVVFLCGHGTCSKCADTLKTCHMCRKTITKKIPIY